MQVCEKRPPYSRGGKSYLTCGLTCARMLEMSLKQSGPITSSPSSGLHGTGYGSRGRGGASLRQPSQPSLIRHLTNHLSGGTTLQQQRKYRGTQSHTGTLKQDSPVLVPMMCVVGLLRSTFFVLLSIHSLGLFGKAPSRQHIRYLWPEMHRETVYYRRNEGK